MENGGDEAEASPTLDSDHEQQSRISQQPNRASPFQARSNSMDFVRPERRTIERHRIMARRLANRHNSNMIFRDREKIERRRSKSMDLHYQADSEDKEPRASKQLTGATPYQGRSNSMDFVRPQRRKNERHRSKSMDLQYQVRRLANRRNSNMILPHRCKIERRRSKSMDLHYQERRPATRRHSNMILIDRERLVLLNLSHGTATEHHIHPLPEFPESKLPGPFSKDTHVSFADQDKTQLQTSPLEQLSSVDTVTSNEPIVGSTPFFQVRQSSERSCVSALSMRGIDCSTQSPAKESMDITELRPRTAMVTWERECSIPNHPHPALEYPPLYFLLRRLPRLLHYSKAFFYVRWRLSYRLQNRIPFTRTFLRKMNVFFTVGEFLLTLPFIIALVVCLMYSFIRPSVSISGHAARAPLIFAFIAATRNSPLTLLFGIPVERAIWYHKLSARLAYINGLMHTYASFVYPMSDVANTMTEDAPSFSVGSDDPNLGRFLFSDTVNSGGTMLIVFMTLMMLTALPFVRRRVFEVFYYLHIAFAASMVICAFCHTGILLPILVACTWVVDIMIRKVYMPFFRYPRKASLRIISDSVVEVCFPKIDGFDYNPGQYIYLAIPELSIFEWHPFSLSSSPEQKIVTLHIRKAGTWTTALYDLASKKMEVSMMLEGPYGSVGVDLSRSGRYSMVMLFSGGIGVTPMQALCNQLMYEHSTGVRELKKLSFIWIERDPNVMQKVDVVRRRRASTDQDLDLEEGFVDESEPHCIATTLLSLFPQSSTTDIQLEDEYPSKTFDDDSDDEEPDGAESLLAIFPNHTLGKKHNVTSSVPDRNDAANSSDDDTMNQSFLDAAYNSGSDDGECESVLDLQVYLTARDSDKQTMANVPFIHHRRPDVKELFHKMRHEAISLGERRVAVCVCAPERLVTICQKACSKYSDHKVRFDFHHEVFG